MNLANGDIGGEKFHSFSLNDSQHSAEEDRITRGKEMAHET